MARARNSVPLDPDGARPEEASGAHRYVTTELFLELLGVDTLERLPDLAPLLPDIDAIEDAW